ncbi:hypothetical protein [Pinibacter aurantiacus]|uniref:Lipoprotein n=1 Tax=Pinibacter aurantiacus TaxID=2851599 RepID=A0A9E2W7Y3_9BACT|nr:hypothetical protein [Pinibacter aurantiacus]MBV4357466.1 hypothetical protein [Pinibacter aurantiacus]
MKTVQLKRRTLPSILFLLQALLLFSCASLTKTIDNENRILITRDNLKDLNGRFKNYSKIGKDSAKGDLYGNIFDFGYNPKDSINFFEFKAVASNKLLVTYWDKNQIIKQKTFTGKFDKGYFVFKRKYLVIPVIMVNLFRNRVFRIGLLKNGNLITDYQQISFGTFYVFLPFYDKHKRYNVEFEKTNYQASTQQAVWHQSEN